MITRATLHTEVYNMAIAPFPVVNNPFRSLVPSDYMNDDTGTFFTKSTFLEIVEHDYS